MLEGHLMFIALQKGNKTNDDMDELFGMVEAFVSNLNAKSAVYACSGTIEVFWPIKLFYDKGTSQDVKVVTFPLTRDDARSLKATCDEAPFGLGSETLIDSTVRRAGTLPAECFAVSGFDLASTNILQTIEKTMLAEEPGTIVFAIPYALNVYEAGDHFASHVDTPKGEMHVGSIVVALPAFVGGELVVRDATYALNRADQRSDRISWVAFFADCEHSVLPVTEGYRITVAYDVFRRNMSPYVRSLRDLHFPLRQEVDQFLRAVRETLPPHVTHLGFGLLYAYPALASVGRNWRRGPHMPPNATDPVVCLKGFDALLYEVISHLGLRGGDQGCLHVRGAKLRKVYGRHVS